MPNSLRTFFQKLSTPKLTGSRPFTKPSATSSVSEDGTVIYRGLQITASNYEFDTLTAEQLRYWIERLPQLGTPFLLIVKPRPGVTHPEFLQTYWETAEQFTFEWWNFARPGLHRVCTLDSVDRVAELMLSWLAGDVSELKRQEWQRSFMRLGN